MFKFFGIDPTNQPEPAPFEPINFCTLCRDHILPDDQTICQWCMKEIKQGYQVRSLAGRCANGAELDHGTLFHALPLSDNQTQSYIALCGAKPGKRSAGWSAWGHGKDVTCKRCIKKLENK